MGLRALRRRGRVKQEASGANAGQENVRVLVVGAGGREHALCWALKRDTPDADLFTTPGNPGTAQLGTNLKIPATAADDIVAAVREHRIDLTIVGPEAPLAAGLADRLRAAGRAVFGPSRDAARIESSKAFAKDVMQRAGVPTAASRSFDALDPALAYIRGHASRSSSRRPGSPPARACWCALPETRRPAPRAPCSLTAPWARRGGRSWSRSSSRERSCRCSPSPTASGSSRFQRPRTTSDWATATPDRTPAAWARTAP